MKKLILLFPLLLLADINPFAAGLNSPNPYGLTPDEKAILKNRKDIDKLNKEIKQIEKNISNLQVKIVAYDQTMSNLSEKLDAFNTILDELNTAQASITKLKQDQNITSTKINQINTKITSLENNLTKIQNEINNLKLTIKTITTVQNQNFQYLKNSIQTILQDLKKLNQVKKKLTPQEAMRKGKEYFYAKKYEKAKPYFEYTLSKKYLPATSAFYLGEIAYFEGNYKLALAYYKKSVDFYPKPTSFTPALLFHTAVCFEKLGNKKAAKATFEKLIASFPKSYFTKVAKEMLAKLK